MKGNRRGGGQDLPWTEIDKLHTYMWEEGVAEGTLIANGDTTDLQAAQSCVAQSIPVISLKAVGGASEYLSQLFERRQIGGPHDRGRPIGFCKRFPEDAVPKEYRSGVFMPPEEATDDEMIVVDANNPDAGKVLQKQMAKLLSLQGASEEKMIGENNEARWCSCSAGVICFALVYQRLIQQSSRPHPAAPFTCRTTLLFILQAFPPPRRRGWSRPG
jgi:hypothetical protein